MSTTAELNSKILSFAEAVGEFGGLAKKMAEEGLAACKEARPLVDKQADAAVSGSLIEEGERDEFAKKASTHVGALQLIGNFVRHIGKLKEAHAQELATLKLGRGVPKGHQKKANVDSTESPFVGGRAGMGEKRASDLALFQGLGINPADIKVGA